MIYSTSNGWEILPMAGYFFRAYLIRRGEINILADTSRKMLRRRLLRQLKQKDVNNLQFIIITHAHFDHTENAAILNERFSAKIITSEKEAEFLAAGISNNIGGTKRFTRWTTSTFRNTIEKKFHYEAVSADITFSDKLIIPGTDEQLRCISVPGHTAGSLALIVDNEIALVGDTLTNHIPGSIFPPFGENHDEILNSWGKLLDTGCKWFLPAHGKRIDRQKLIKALQKKRLKKKF